MNESIEEALVIGHKCGSMVPVNVISDSGSQWHCVHFDPQRGVQRLPYKPTAKESVSAAWSEEL